MLLTFLLGNFSGALIFLFDITMTRTKCNAFKKTAADRTISSGLSASTSVETVQASPVCICLLQLIFFG